MLTMPTPEIPIGRFEVFATGLDHPECVAFDHGGRLWAGGETGQIYRIDAAGRPHTVASLGGFTGGLAFSPLDQALYACNPALGLVRVDTDGRHSVFATGAGGRAMVTPNYPVFDRRGRLYVSDSGKWKVIPPAHRTRRIGSAGTGSLPIPVGFDRSRSTSRALGDLCGEVVLLRWPAPLWGRIVARVPFS
jgi:sugar lactone lactonase YvrE